MTPDQRRAWRKRIFGFARTDLRQAQKVVLLALETYADYPAGTNARPGINNLASICALDERTVRFALKAGERLNLIEQTARANPKRGLAAVYRLLPQSISTGSLDTVDEVSTGSADPLEPTFNRIESQFLPDRIDVSTGSLDPPTNPYQASNTKGEGACETENPPTSETDQSADGTPSPSVQTANSKGSSTPPPSPYCPRHPQGSPTGCHSCGDARRARETWDQTQAARLAAARAAIRAEIRACPDCGQNGLTEPDEGPARRCTRHRQLADLDTPDRKAS